jgi:hypothetical protein
MDAITATDVANTIAQPEGRLSTKMEYRTILFHSVHEAAPASRSPEHGDVTAAPGL